jgi:hypothetical protein
VKHETNLRAHALFLVVRAQALRGGDDKAREHSHDLFAEALKVERKAKETESAQRSPHLSLEAV